MLFALMPSRTSPDTLIRDPPFIELTWSFPRMFPLMWLKGKFDDHGCMYSNNACTSCDDGCCNYVSCIYTMDDGCKKYDCLSPENCASLGGENHGNWQD